MGVAMLAVVMWGAVVRVGCVVWELQCGGLKLGKSQSGDVVVTI